MGLLKRLLNAEAAESPVFYATYGETKSAEIEAAYQAGKLVICKRRANGREYLYYLARRSNAANHLFGSVCLVQASADDPTRMAQFYGVRCSNDEWDGMGRYLVTTLMLEQK